MSSDHTHTDLSALGLLTGRVFDPPFVLPAGVSVRSRVVFLRHGTRELLADLFLPQAAERAPAIVYIFGGGWRIGTRDDFYRQAALLAAQGIAGMCIDYRLSGEASYPAAVHDSKAAVRYLRTHAAELQVDSTRIGCVGYSSGGHLAAMLATTADDPVLEGDGNGGVSSAVTAAVLFNPLTDLRNIGTDSPRVRANIEAFLGATEDSAPELYAQASPVLRLSREAAPCLVFQATADEAVPYRTAMRFVDAAAAIGVEARLAAAPEQNHGYFLRPPWFETTLLEMEAFLNHVFSMPAAAGSA